MYHGGTTTLKLNFLRHLYSGLFTQCSNSDSSSELKVIMFLHLVILLLFPTLSSTRKPLYGKVIIENKSKDTIRVILVPPANWDLYDQRTNKTILPGHGERVGGNHIRLDFTQSIGLGPYRMDHMIHTIYISSTEVFFHTF